MMHCARCGKPLIRSAFTVRTAKGPADFGPKCAKYIEVREVRYGNGRTWGLRAKRQPEPDPAQSELEFQ